MSYVALATDQFDAVVAFYGVKLGFPIVERWDRPGARGLRFDLGGMRLEILDNCRERRHLALGEPADRVHIVIEVDDVDLARSRISAETPVPQTVSWGARLFRLRDPDGIPVTYLQWLKAAVRPLERIAGRVASGSGRGQHFTQIDWVRRQFIDKLGIDPFPGTLNVIVQDQGDVDAWIGLRGTPGIRIQNPGNGPGDCHARCYRVSVDGEVDAAIVLPEVEGYSEREIELIAPVSLRQVLGKHDGDEVSLELVNVPDLPTTTDRNQTA